MSRMYIAFLLDFFQPPRQKYGLLREIIAECYRPLVEMFNFHQNARFTVSIAKSLVELLTYYDESEIIDRLKQATESGHVELMHTAAYHPILPLLEEQEVRRQIKLDVECKEEAFGVTKRSGFFSPEMCYEDRFIPVFQDLGFRWTVVDDGVMGMHGIEVPDRAILHVGHVAVLMRSSFWSNRIRPSEHSELCLTGKEFIEQLEQEASGRTEDCYRVVALSAETFGHHNKYYEETFLRDMLFALDRSRAVQLCCVSDLLTINSLPHVQKRWEPGGFYFPRCSWATQPEDCQRGDPYPHWSSRSNAIHERLWALTNVILESCRGIDFESPVNQKLRRTLDRAFYCTQYFSASIWFWKPSLIYEGIDLQMRALYRCARLTGNEQALIEGQRIYADLMMEIMREVYRRPETKSIKEAELTLQQEGGLRP